jgi:hypothetical protein
MIFFRGFSILGNTNAAAADLLKTEREFDSNTPQCQRSAAFITQLASGSSNLGNQGGQPAKHRNPGRNRGFALSAAVLWLTTFCYQLAASAQAGSNFRRI